MEFTRSSRYLIVGIVSVGIYVLTTWWLVDIYELVVKAGVAVGYTTATVFNYIGNYYWTFESSRRHVASVPRYTTLVFLGLIYNELLIAVLGYVLDASIALHTFLAAVSWSIFAFTGMRFWAFKSQTFDRTL